MKVAIVSDTHGVTHVIEYIKTLLNDSDVLIHLGDNINDVKLLSEGFKGKVYSVVNCDYERNGQVEQVIEIEGKKFLITH